MRISIRLKMAAILGAVIILFVAVSILLSSLFLNDYYIYRKEGQLKDTFNTVSRLYAANPADLAEQLDAIESESSIHITIFNKNLDIQYTSRPIRGQNEQNPAPSLSPRQGEESEPEEPRGGPFNFEANQLKRIAERINTQGVVIERIGQDRGQNRGQNMGLLQLGAKLNVDTMVYLRTAVAAIQESVGVANTFYLYTGILTLILGVVIVLFVSRGFARPITELSAIAKRMEKLDFNAKFTRRPKDEITVLGDSINALSDQLHKHITELEQANEALKEDVLRKEETDKMRREFLSSASHELKTPLALIQGYAEGLALNIHVDEASRKEYCDVIMDETKKMDKLVKQLLDLSKMESGQMKLSWEDFNLLELVERATKKHRIEFEKAGIQLVKNIEADIMVHADFEMMERALDNYLSNAIRHANAQKTIRISAKREDGKAILSVFNSGKGIPEEEMEKIWTSFYKADKARTRELGGTGLGLSIVKAVIDAHGESCGARNVAGGVEFWFTMELAMES